MRKKNDLKTLTNNSSIKHFIYFFLNKINFMRKKIKVKFTGKEDLKNIMLLPKKKRRRKKKLK